ncbi:MAG: hypothetical protein Kow0032_14170 [Methyloligellaceae bacterium]
MANQSQIALSNGQPRRKASVRRSRKQSKDGKSEPAAKAQKKEVRSQLKIRPAFLPETEVCARDAPAERDAVSAIPADRAPGKETAKEAKQEAEKDITSDNESSSSAPAAQPAASGEKKAADETETEPGIGIEISSPSGESRSGAEGAGLSGDAGADAPAAADDAEDTEGDQKPLLLADAVGPCVKLATPATPASDQVTDPELLELLEQLSQTLDTANQVLSETPIRLGEIRGDQGLSLGQEPGERGEAGAGGEETAAQAAAAAGAAPLTAADEGLLPPPAPTRMIRRSRRLGVTSGLAALFAGLFVVSAGGSYFWFKANPWLDGDRGIAAKTSSQAALLPAAAGTPDTPPLPLRKPLQERVAALEGVNGTTQPGEAATPLAAPMSTLDPQADAKSPVAPSQTPAAAARQVGDGDPGRVEGPAGQPLPVSLDIPARTDDSEISIMIQGVPDGVTLSAGNRIGNGTWILTEEQAKGLTLAAAEDFPARSFTLDVALVRSNGKIPESRVVNVTIAPATGMQVPPAETSPAAITAPLPGKGPETNPAAAEAKALAIAPVPQKGEPEEKTEAFTAKPETPKPAPKEKITAEEEARFLERANALLELFDVASARLVLEHAARRGSTQAMLLLAKTYDPEHLARLGVRGVTGDKAQATAWYERASRKADR